MAEIIDLALHQACSRVVDDLLERRGLGYFLERQPGFPFALDDRRVSLAMELATRRLRVEPPADVIDASRRIVRRRLIALVAEAMIGVGY